MPNLLNEPVLPSRIMWCYVLKTARHTQNPGFVVQLPSQPSCLTFVKDIKDKAQLPVEAIPQLVICHGSIDVGILALTLLGWTHSRVAATTKRPFAAHYVPFETDFLKCDDLAGLIVARLVHYAVCAFADFLGTRKID